MEGKKTDHVSKSILLHLFLKWCVCMMYTYSEVPWTPGHVKDSQNAPQVCASPQRFGPTVFGWQGWVHTPTSPRSPLWHGWFQYFVNCHVRQYMGVPYYVLKEICIFCNALGIFVRKCQLAVWLSLSVIALFQCFLTSLILGEQEDCHGDCPSSYDPYGSCWGNHV